MLISINWKISKEKCQLFDLTESSLNRWFWVFETLRTYDLEIFKLEDHIDRLFKSAEIIWLKSSYSRAEIEKNVDEILIKWKEKISNNEKNKNSKKDGYIENWKLKTENWKLKTWNIELSKEARIKITLTQHYLIIFFEKNIFDTNIYKGVWACFYKWERFLPEAKTLNCLISHLANTSAKNKGLFEAILINNNGFVTEWAYSNIFWIRQWVLYTTNEGVLDWITRQTILDNALRYVKDIKFDNKMTQLDLQQVDELFMSQSSKWIVPIVELEWLMIWDWKVGEVTKKLSNIF